MFAASSRRVLQGKNCTSCVPHWKRRSSTNNIGGFRGTSCCESLHSLVERYNFATDRIVEEEPCDYKEGISYRSTFQASDDANKRQAFIEKEDDNKLVNSERFKTFQKELQKSLLGQRHFSTATFGVVSPKRTNNNSWTNFSANRSNTFIACTNLSMRTVTTSEHFAYTENRGGNSQEILSDDVEEDKEFVNDDDDEEEYYDENDDDDVLDVRISKLIASLKDVSRKEAERIIRDPQVKIRCNDELVTSAELKIQVCRDADHIRQSTRNSSNNNNLGHTKEPALILQIKAGNKQQQQETYELSWNEVEDITLTSGQTSPQTTKERTRIWLVHKLRGEMVSEFDAQYNRPCLMQRLRIGGVGGRKDAKQRRNRVRKTLIPIGRLDMTTEGLILVTNDGMYSHMMEHPSNGVTRTYRARVHGLMAYDKLQKMKRGVTIEGIRYRGMDVLVEQDQRQKRRERADSNSSTTKKKGGSNTWLKITCHEGKNRQIRKVLAHFGLTVTRLIRTGYGTYKLGTIPPGMAVEVPVKPLESQITSNTTTSRRMKGPTLSRQKKESQSNEPLPSPVEWIKHR